MVKVIWIVVVKQKKHYLSKYWPRSISSCGVPTQRRIKQYELILQHTSAHFIEGTMLQIKYFMWHLKPIIYTVQHYADIILQLDTFMTHHLFNHSLIRAVCVALGQLMMTSLTKRFTAPQMPLCWIAINVDLYLLSNRNHVNDWRTEFPEHQS